MDIYIPPFDYLDNYYKPLQIQDNLDPPPVTDIKSVEPIKLKPNYINDLVFFTGIYCFLHIGWKTIYNIGSISINLLTKNFITNYYKHKHIQQLTIQLKRQFIKKNTDRSYELNYNNIQYKGVVLKHENYLSLRNNNEALVVNDVNSLDQSFKDIETDLIFTNNQCPIRWNDIIMMENDIVNIVKSLYNAGDDISGNLIESIHSANLSVCLSYINSNIKNRERYEIIVSKTVHPSFFYIAQILNIKLICVDIDLYSGKMLQNKIKSIINKNTLFIIASASSYSHGIIDNISQLSELAFENCIGLHIDCLSDNFLLPFLKINGTISCNFDFSLKGVTTLSTNLAIDSNVTKELRCVLIKNSLIINQQFVNKNPIYGICAFTNFNSEIKGNVIAYYWYYLQMNGIKHFIDKANSIIDLKNYFIKKLVKINHFTLVGEPFLGRLAINMDSNTKFIFSEYLFGLGWNLIILNNPSAIGISITDNFKDESDIDRFFNNMNEVVYKNENKIISKSTILGVKHILKNVNQSALLGEIFMSIRKYI
jgi:glutamate/tyrosine decarboxylase-like PLP-dependent enzyme